MLRWDLVLVAMAACHAAAVLAMPAAPLIAIGVWWNSNTVAHNFIHRPFFRSRSLNLIFSACQSVLIGVPQTLWRDRHLAHHAGVPWRLQGSWQLLLETAGICALWTGLVITSPDFFFTVHMPGYLAGLALCAMQGHYEHAGVVTSHYGRIYNLLCFNDGYHVEHHRYPGVHWTELPRRAVAEARVSRWPALLRWLDSIYQVPHLLDALERVVLRSPRLQRFVLNAHRSAFRAVLQELPPVGRVAVIGGGLFPRTAMVLRELLPDAEIVVIDQDERHLEIARRIVGPGVTFEHACFSAADAPRDVDLIVIPLAFQGDRAVIYRRPPARAVVVHDWLWRRRGQGCLVSLALFKRLNLVRA